MVFKRPLGWRADIGSSVALNGVCSTVREIDTTSFTIEYMPETLKKTTMSDLQKGGVVKPARW